jgi:hypothetical protein
MATPAYLHAEAGAARLRPGSRAAYFIASVMASRPLQFGRRCTQLLAGNGRAASGRGPRPHSLACEPLGGTRDAGV